MIEVNEYVRTNKGNIGKVVETRLGFNKDTQLYQKIYMLDNGLWTILEYIVKHSKQLIDLVEVGDYVNGYKVIKLKDGFANGTMEIVLSNNTIIYRHHSEDIETILTKEKFETNCYKVGEE